MEQVGYLDHGVGDLDPDWAERMDRLLEKSRAKCPRCGESTEWYKLMGVCLLCSFSPNRRAG